MIKIKKLRQIHQKIPRHFKTQILEVYLPISDFFWRHLTKNPLLKTETFRSLFTHYRI